MIRNLAILAAAAAILALPFVLRDRPPAAATGSAQGEERVLTVITPHNDAIRQEFGWAFSRWHAERHGSPVDVRWVVIGGTTEISRFLEGQYTEAARAWWRSQGRSWRAGMRESIFDRRFGMLAPPELERGASESDADFAARAAEAAARHREAVDLWRAFRATDDPRAFTSRIDIFFGGGQYDFQRAAGQGLLVPPWPAGREPADLFRSAGGADLLPETMNGEIWRTDTYFSTALSTFGIAFNLDRIAEAGLPEPRTWDDLSAPALFRSLGVADPTKSGSAAKAFEMIVHQACREAVARAGFADADIDAWESALATAAAPPGDLPPGVPEAYQRALNEGWIDGLNRIRRIGAQARYFTDSSSKVPFDIGAGHAAAGLAIDFYARFQEAYSRAADGRARMRFVTPVGGSSVSGDPIALLRGAEHREVACRFIEFVLGVEGQRLWTYRPGEPGGPVRYALRRVPARRDFYPSADPEIHAAHLVHRRHTADDLAAPHIDPYALASTFVYRPRWTAGHFGVLRDIVRAMCLDSHEELQSAWAAILRAGGPGANPEAMRAFERMPDGPRALDWASARRAGADRLDAIRDWTLVFRQSYREARALADRPPDSSGGKPN